jgi:uracil-DNA glycosylase
MGQQTFSQNVLKFHFSLQPEIQLKNGVEWIYPFDDVETRRSMTQFYEKYFNDKNSRHFILGINPGRFGAGITGVPFTDPVRLENECGIMNTFQKRQELSSKFVYEFIEAMGGVDSFNKQFYITSLCPLGFIKNGKNYNYYDDKTTEMLVTPFIIQNIDTQLSFGGRRRFGFCMGQGKNFQYLKKLNEKYQWFEEVIPLPHPRWVMQYRLKRKQEFLDEYTSKLSMAI